MFRHDSAAAFFPKCLFCCITFVYVICGTELAVWLSSQCPDAVIVVKLVCMPMNVCVLHNTPKLWMTIFVCLVSIFRFQFKRVKKKSTSHVSIDYSSSHIGSSSVVVHLEYVYQCIHYSQYIIFPKIAKSTSYCINRKEIVFVMSSVFIHLPVAAVKMFVWWFFISFAFTVNSEKL